MTNEVKWICDSCKTSGMTIEEFERHNCGDVVMQLRASNARLRELLGEALDRIPHWQRCAIFDNPEEQCDCERSDIQSRIQSELKE